MALGPIEILLIAFPGNQFNGEILPELERLVEAGTISVVDGLLVSKLDDGEVPTPMLPDSLGCSTRSNRSSAMRMSQSSPLTSSPIARLLCSYSNTPGQSRSGILLSPRVALSPLTSVCLE